MPHKAEKSETEGNRTSLKDTVCDYLQEVFDDINARESWNKTDNTIIEYRGGKRGKKHKPYKGAPNPVVNILDDVTSNKTDIEISMQMNTPRLVNVIPLSEDCPIDYPSKLAQGLDTLMRYAIRFRMKKEVLTDMKNLRGFSVCKLTRYDHPKFGLIPDFVAVDPKDAIVPVDTQVPVSRYGERIAFILRLSPRQVRKREETKGWKNTKEVLDQLTNQAKGESYASSSLHDEETENTLKIKQKMLGINVSDFAHQSIVVYEIYHYATQWDVDNDTTGRVKIDEACVTYICPDVPNKALKVMPWRMDNRIALEGDELANELRLAKDAERPPKLNKIDGKKDKPWPAIQPRYENKSLFWYDSWGAGRKCLDNHIIATKMKKKKLIQIDYYTNPMFKDDGSGNNEQNVMPAPGKSLPKGKDFAQMPVVSSKIDFDIDSEKRDAAQKSGSGGGSQFSAQVSDNRKLQKTAEEVRTQSAESALLSSASVDRFNDSDIELYEMLFEDCRELRVKLPIIHNDQYSGFVPMEVYDFEYIFSPATSQKHLNPDIQFQKDMQAYTFATSFQDQTPMRIYESLKYVLTRHDPFFTDILLQDPSQEAGGGEPSVYDILRQMMAQVEQLGLNSQEQDKEIEAGLKLAQENAEEIEKVQAETEKLSEEHKEIKSNAVSVANKVQ